MNPYDPDDYYLRRAEISRSMAEQAKSPDIAAIHDELATRYEQLAAQSRRTENYMLMGQTT